jgi:hypothetical protein
LKNARDTQTLTAVLGRIATVSEEEPLWPTVELAITAGPLPPNGEKPAEKEIKKDKGVGSNT